ncbi:hypothetical protein [Brevibacillus sp. NRS-1366]|uniref:hypothetical protein n=1 Tax=Brevibacillus sp. NRS-1366 TaxID=3233899 RepID=UPI003D202ACB
MKIDEIIKLKKFVEGGTFQNGRIEKLSDRYSQQNANAISSFDIIIASNRANVVYRNGLSYKCVIDYGKLPSKSNLKSAQQNFNRELWTRRTDIFKTGDIVEFTHDPLEKMQTFILLNSINTRDEYDLSIMQATQGTLKWLDPFGFIKETPFTQKSSSSAYPLQDDKIMILSKERRVILVQANDDTKQIKKDRRFIFDERCWKVIGYNGLVEGLLELTLEEDQFHDTLDNIELRIADYYGKVANYKVSILNGSSGSLSLDDSLQLNVRVTNNESVVDSPPLLFTSTDESIATVDVNGLITPISVGEVVINVECNGAISNITLQVTEKRIYNYTLDILGSSEIKINQPQEYHVIFYSNGTPIHDKATFTLTSLDGTPTTLASIKTTTDTSCVVTAGKTTGKLLLHAANQNGLITGSKEIKIKSLI